MLGGNIKTKTSSRQRRGFDLFIFFMIAVILPILVMPGCTSSYGYNKNPMDTPIITELMSSNTGMVTNEDGRYCDWIEICNPSDHPVDLAGYTITDNPQMPDKYVLPCRVLDPGGYVLIYADDQPSTDTELHVPFKLKSKGEMLLLFNPKGVEIQRISFPAMENNYSYAMDMDTGEWAVTERCTPGLPNLEEEYEVCRYSRRAFSPVVINEVMASNSITLRDEDGDYSDWVELYNASLETVDLSGWGLSDTEAIPKRWEFPAAEIGPGDRLVVFLSGKNRADSGKELHTDFKVNKDQDTLLLSNFSGQIVSEVVIHELSADASYGLIPGTDTYQIYYQPTPGYPNDHKGWNAFQKTLYGDMDTPVVFNEIMSNPEPSDDQPGEPSDWIELYNRSDAGIDLAGWGLTDTTGALGRWTFPACVLGPGEYLTVYASGGDISSVPEDGLHTDFKIGGEGEILVLTDPKGDVADRCYIPFLRTGLTYQRVLDELCFEYCDQPTPGAANTAGYPGMAATPSYSVRAGMYDDAQEVELSSADPDARIYYTLDGGTPDENATPYTGPIAIEKTAAIRAVAYLDGYLPSNTACATYLIGEDIDLPVVSIVTDPDNLFDEEFGIYADGPGWTPESLHKGANYWMDWERPAHVELLEPDGTVGISQEIGIKIFGYASRKYDKKSFALMSRSRYGESTFDYQVFPELPYKSYRHLVVRNGGVDYDRTLIRNQLQAELAQETADIDVQAYRQSILFINGEFWGIYDLMEKNNEALLARHHGVNPDKIDFLEHISGNVITGSNEDYLALIEYIRTHDLSVQENYEFVESQMDIDNYIDWFTIEMFINNTDLRNTKMWRPHSPGGKWRWILFDLDWGFQFLHQNQHKDKLDVFSSFLHPEGSGIDHAYDNTLVLGLLANEGFKQQFIKRFIYHCTVTFETAKVLAKIDELAANIGPYMQRNMDRWPSSRYDTMDEWNDNLKLVRDFAIERPAINLYYMQQYFGLTDAEMRQLLADTPIEWQDK